MLVAQPDALAGYHGVVEGIEVVGEPCEYVRNAEGIALPRASHGQEAIEDHPIRLEVGDTIFSAEA